MDMLDRYSAQYRFLPPRIMAQSIASRSMRKCTPLNSLEPLSAEIPDTTLSASACRRRQALPQERAAEFWHTGTGARCSCKCTYIFYTDSNIPQAGIREGLEVRPMLPEANYTAHYTFPLIGQEMNRSKITWVVQHFVAGN